MPNLAESHPESSRDVEPQSRAVSSRGREAAASQACGRCLLAAKTVTDAVEGLAALIDSASPCESCVHQSAMRIVAEQFRMRLPRWWVVDGKVVVPIWIVELLKSYPGKFVEPVRARAA
jgi:hypothetical protein